MKVKLSLLFIVGLLVSIPTAAQTRRVTNADLEKFRQKRLQAEKDYTENYAKMGFPSPEELQKQLEKSRVEREALAARLTAERIARERAQAEAEAARLSLQNMYLMSQFSGYPGYGFGYPTGYYGYYGSYGSFGYGKDFHSGHRRGRFPRLGGPRPLPIRAFGAPTTPFPVATSPFGSPRVGGVRARGRR